MGQQLKVNPENPDLLEGVKIKDLKRVQCIVCKGEDFVPVVDLLFISSFQSSGGNEKILDSYKGFACIHCGAVNELNIKDVKKRKV
jgi:hypothetical protein